MIKSIIHASAIRNAMSWLRQHRTVARYSLMCVPNITRIVRIDPIGPFQIELRRHRSFWLRDPLTHEHFMLGALKRLIQPGDVVYDVGANIGMYTRFMVSAFQAGHVVSFEPMSANVARLTNNIYLAGEAASKIRISAIALGEHDGEQELQVDDIMSASAVLSSITGGLPSEGRRNYGLPPLVERVSVARLDSLVEGNLVLPPDVMKIDIEGAEGMMLRGAIKTLRLYRPRLAIELHGVERAHEVLDVLEECGYWCFGYTNIGDQHIYKHLQMSDVINLKGLYDLQYIVASCDPKDVCQPIDRFVQ